MAEIEKLVYATSIDSQGWTDGLAAGESALMAFHETAASKLTNLKVATPSIDMGKMVDSSSVMSSIGPMLSIGNVIADKIVGSIKKITPEIEKAAQTISRQLKDAFEFQRMEAGTKHFAANWHKSIEDATKDLHDFKAEIAHKTASMPHGSIVDPKDVQTLKNLEKSLENLNKGAAKFNTEASKNFLEGFAKYDSPGAVFHKRTKTFKDEKDKKSKKPKSSNSDGFAVFGFSPGKMASAAGGLISLAGPLAIVSAGVAAVGASFAWIGKGIKGASDLAETINRVDVTLGTGSPAVQKFADQMASKFGLVRNETLAMTADFGGLGKSLGRLNGDQLVGFSTGMTKLAADLSSFANIDATEAAQAIQTTLAGNQSDRLKALGVVVNEATVKQYALAHGIAKVGMELNEQQKFTARTALITQGLSRASGDLERTQDGAANQSRKLWGQIENLGTSIGTVLLPVVNTAMKMMNEFLSFVTTGFEANKTSVDGWVDTFLTGFDWITAAAHNIPAVFEVMRLSVVQQLANLGAFFDVLGPNIVTIAEYVANNWTDLLVDAFNATYQALLNFGKNFYAVADAVAKFLADPTQGFQVDWTPILDGFEATAEKLPELLKPAVVDMSKVIADAAKPITMEVASKRAKREAAKAAGGPKLVDTPVAAEAAKMSKADKKDEVKFAGALELGSKEAYSSIVTATAGKSKGLEETARNTRTTAANTAEIARNTRQARPNERARIVRIS